jgi:hypothetical protein
MELPKQLSIMYAYIYTYYVYNITYVHSRTEVTARFLVSENKELRQMAFPFV